VYIKLLYVLYTSVLLIVLRSDFVFDFLIIGSSCYW